MEDLRCRACHPKDLVNSDSTPMAVAAFPVGLSGRRSSPGTMPCPIARRALEAHRTAPVRRASKAPQRKCAHPRGSWRRTATLCSITTRTRRFRMPERCDIIRARKDALRPLVIVRLSPCHRPRAVWFHCCAGRSRSYTGHQHHVRSAAAQRCHPGRIRPGDRTVAPFGRPAAHRRKARCGRAANDGSYRSSRGHGRAAHRFRAHKARGAACVHDRRNRGNAHAAARSVSRPCGGPRATMASTKPAPPRGIGSIRVAWPRGITNRTTRHGVPSAGAVRV